MASGLRTTRAEPSSSPPSSSSRRKRCQLWLRTKDITFMAVATTVALSVRKSKTFPFPYRNLWCERWGTEKGIQQLALMIMTTIGLTSAGPTGPCSQPVSVRMMDVRTDGAARKKGCCTFLRQLFLRYANGVWPLSDGWWLDDLGAELAWLWNGSRVTAIRERE